VSIAPATVGILEVQKLLGVARHGNRPALNASALTGALALASADQVHNQKQTGGNPENRGYCAIAHFEISLDGNFVLLNETASSSGTGT
jgi:hypothetical protein